MRQAIWFDPEARSRARVLSSPPENRSPGFIGTLRAAAVVTIFAEILSVLPPKYPENLAQP